MRFWLPTIFLIACLFTNAQHQDKVDFTRGEITIAPNPKTESIDGSVTYDFKVLQDVDSVFLDAKNMDFSSVRLNGKRIRYTNTRKRICISKNFKKGKDYQLELKYSCTPEQTVYFIGWEDKNSRNKQSDQVDGTSTVAKTQIWTQGQGKYTSHWLPSFDSMEEKVEFDLKIVFDEIYDVIANGKLISVGSISDGKLIWKFDMKHPMSSYLLAFAIGHYDSQHLTSKSGVPIKNYYYPGDSLRAEPTYRHTQEIFDFLEDEIGIPYPWQNYKQLPVHDFLYAGMENTGTTIFSDGYVIDSTAFVDKNYVNVNAHELAHQWFGNLVTEKTGHHHWLHEGFATYYAYLAEKEIFGDEHFYWKLQATLTELQDQVEKGKGQSLLDPQASSLTFYEKGAWALFMLREQIGDGPFKKGIQSYLRTYQFKNVRVSDFLEEMEKASGNDLSGFRTDWLENSGIPYKMARERLAERSASLKLLSDMEAQVKTSSDDKTNYVKYWDGSPSIHLKKYILKNYWKDIPKEIIERTIASDTIPVRQLLALVGGIKRVAKEDFESLLADKSYVTIESALFQLWKAYPKERTRYLDSTDDVIGLPNKNVRLLWLTLALLTEDYQPNRSNQFLAELRGYTDTKYSFEIQQGTFYFLKEAFGFSDQNLKDLIQATNHHSWQFRKFARSLLEGLLEDETYKKRIQSLKEELNAEDLRYLNSSKEQ